jgi:hypothetical protein
MNEEKLYWNYESMIGLPVKISLRGRNTQMDTYKNYVNGFISLYKDKIIDIGSISKIYPNEYGSDRKIEEYVVFISLNIGLNEPIKY